MNRIVMLVIALVPVFARAEVIWRGDFSTGDLSQWSAAETVDAKSRLRVVSDPVGRGGPALRALVRLGDDPIGASGHRNELLFTDDDVQEGDERYYRWETLFPADFKPERTWQLFTQWHHYGCCGSPPLAFYVNGEEVRLGLASGEVLWSAPLEQGAWQAFVFHVRWSSNPAQGYVELWHDGRNVLPRRHAATLLPGDGAYLKQGLYRSTTVRHDQVVFHRGMVIGTTLDDVWPRTSDPSISMAVPTSRPSDGTPVATNGPLIASAAGAGGCASAPVVASALPLAALFLRRRRFDRLWSRLHGRLRPDRE